MKIYLLKSSSSFFLLAEAYKLVFGIRNGRERGEKRGEKYSKLSHRHFSLLAAAASYNIRIVYFSYI
jgi:hypothetical protein